MRKEIFTIRSIVLAISCLLLICEALPQSLGWRIKHSSVGLTVGINPRNERTIFAEERVENIAVSFDKGISWPLHLFPGILNIRQILVHPSDTNTIFCAASSHLRKSTDFGSTWKTVLEIFDIDGESITYDPVHPDTMFAGRFSGGDVYRSTDRGETWIRTGAAGNQLCAFAVRPDSSSILLGGTGSGTISKSTNNGVSWKIVKQPISGVLFQEVPKISVSSTNPLIAYATISGDPHPTLGVWKTVDGGDHWAQTNAPHFSFWGMDIDPANASVVYAGTFQEGVSAVYKTTDGGTTWNALAVGFPEHGYIWSIKLHPMNPTELWSSVTRGASGAQGVYRLSSLKGTIQGVVRDDITGNAVANGFVTNAGTRDTVHLADSTGAFTLAYYDGDSTTTPVIHLQAYPYFLKGIQVTFQIDSAAHQDFTMHPLDIHSVSGVIRDSLTQLPLSASVGLSIVTSLGNSSISIVSDTNGRFSFDSLYISYPPINDYPSLSIDPEIPYAKRALRSFRLDTTDLAFSIDLPHADVFIISAADSGKYLSYYTSVCESLHLTYNTWDVLQRGSAPLTRAREFLKKSVMYYTGDKHTSLTQTEQDTLTGCLDAGCNLLLTGQDIAEMNDSTPLLRNYLGIGFGGNATIAFNTGLPGEIFAGLSFFTLPDGTVNQTSRDILTIINGSGKAVMGYGNGSAGIAAVRLDSVGAGGKAIVMGFGFESISGGDSRANVMNVVVGYFDGSNVVGVDEGGRLPRPKQFTLSQNFPNPFNPRTMITYELPEFSTVQIRVYDLLGRQIATLVNQSQPQGAHSITFDAGALPSGVYYYRLTTSTFTCVKKMVVLR